MARRARGTPSAPLVISGKPCQLWWVRCDGAPTRVFCDLTHPSMDELSWRQAVVNNAGEQNGRRLMPARTLPTARPSVVCHEVEGGITHDLVAVDLAAVGLVRLLRKNKIDGRVRKAGRHHWIAFDRFLRVSERREEWMRRQRRKDRSSGTRRRTAQR